MKDWVATYSNRPQPSPRFEQTVPPAGKRRSSRMLRPPRPALFDDESETPTRPLPVLERLEDVGERDERR